MPVPGSASNARERIDILDGFRGLAVLAVIGFHFFTRWTPPYAHESFYPYGSLLAGVAPFRYGYLGVHLFFLVSGFVISLTLARCRSATEFAVRRAARLVPAMIVAACATYLVVGALSPHLWVLQPCDFLPSLTFVHPLVYERFFHLSCHYIDGSYWSLFVEVRFYAIAALLYFGVSRRHFLAACAVFLTAALALSAVPPTALPDLVSVGIDTLFFPKWAPWLFSGVGFYFLWTGEQRRLAAVLVLEGLGVNVAEAWLHVPNREWLVVILNYALFTGFALRLAAMRVFAVGLLTRIGAASYSLYLLHQEIGVTLIAWLAHTVQMTGPESLLIAATVTGLLILLSFQVYRRVELPAQRSLTRWALGRGQA